MADALNITSGILAAGGSALKASTALHELIRSFRSQDRDARALEAEINDLNVVLESLLEMIANNPNHDFTALELPLQRCGRVCEEYYSVVQKCTQRSSDKSRPSVRDWIAQKYLQGDINNFKEMLAMYKATIKIALADANL